MKAIPKRGYTLFLQSQCGYACGDRETSAFGHKRADGRNEHYAIQIRLLIDLENTCRTRFSSAENSDRSLNYYYNGRQTPWTLLLGRSSSSVR